ncbi:MAG: 23S rRNA (uracil(1939)-C(5))-methyltransferase RlmD [Bacteroidetes bacterium]|nr:MAG: 23S rRNA (uracil(1939)-C(5))-methyltransferase RlmD [Bacteroidota bacterium]
MRTAKQPLIIENLQITAAGAEGNCIGRHENKVVFVRRAVPGDVVNVRVIGKKKSFYEAEVIEVVTPSPQRVTPFCAHFGECGGCKWQQMDYAEQLRNKHQMVIDAFERIGKIEVGEVLPIQGCDENRFYRNRMDYAFSNKRWLSKTEMDIEDKGELNALGFHIPGRFDKVLNIDKCWLQDDMANNIRNAVRNYTISKGYTFFDLREQHGLMRGLIIRNSTVGEWMVIVMFHGNDTDAMDDVMGYIETSFPQITSLLYVINNKRNDTIYDQDVLVWKGKDHMLEKLGNLTFKVRPKSFFQTNTRQAETLYNIAVNFAGLTGNEVVYDLYTGTGTIANYVAGTAKKVVGIEYIEQAIDDARENAAFNNITNTVFYAGDMKDVLNDAFIAKNGTPDLIITDPPRAGMHADVVKKICEIGAPRVVYVSCNAATQARDLDLMRDTYRVVKIQPVDMFPHTAHVENVALLEKI